MVAVLALSQVGGGWAHPAMASPKTRVESTRDSRINRRLAALYRQFTERPVRLMTAAAPSNSCRHGPKVRASQAMFLEGPSACGERLRTVMSYPWAFSERAKRRPNKPLPPARTTHLEFMFLMSFISIISVYTEITATINERQVVSDFWLLI